MPATPSTWLDKGTVRWQHPTWLIYYCGVRPDWPDKELWWCKIQMDKNNTFFKNYFYFKSLGTQNRTCDEYHEENKRNSIRKSTRCISTFPFYKVIESSQLVFLRCTAHWRNRVFTSNVSYNFCGCLSFPNKLLHKDHHLFRNSLNEEKGKKSCLNCRHPGFHLSVECIV